MTSAGVDYLDIGHIVGNNDDRTVVHVFRVPERRMAWNGSDQGNIVRSYDTLTRNPRTDRAAMPKTLLSERR